MNSDRTALVDPATSSWNEWLMQLTANFALDLLTQEWVDSFGAAAYLALEESRQPSALEFAADVSRGLRERECWPSRQRTSSSRRPLLQVANEIMMGASPELDALVPDERRLDPRITHPRVVKMARSAGAKDFTVSSAIRLRCAGKNASHLATNLGDDVAIYYTSFPDGLADIDRQDRFARAFEVHRRQLTPANRSDLSEAPTTLTAGGTLAAPSHPLWVVDEAVAAVSPVAATQRLHPRLTQYKAVSRECQPFDTSAWARDVAAQAAAGTAAEGDRDALYRYLLRSPEVISRAAWPALRRAPIVLDHRGEWVTPAAMIQRRTGGTLRVEAALHFPSREMARHPMLLRRLRPRTKLAGTDLVNYARIVAETPSLAEDFEETLHQLRRLLTRPTVTSLRSIPFLRSTQNELVAPEDSYVRTAHLLNCVGPEVNFAAGRHTKLHARLGCRTQPEADEIVNFLNSLRATGNGPAHPDDLYPALLEALKAEGDASRLAAKPILFADGEWHAPEAVLVGKRHRRIFFGGVPVVAVGSLEQGYEALGACAEPSAEHWIQFFGWINERSDSGARRLAAAERKALRSAYSKLGSLPIGVPAQARVFLDTSGRLHSRADVRASRYLINDDPPAADVVAEAGLPVAFADVADASTRRFYRSSDVPLLTEARRHTGIKVGAERPSPPWFQESLVLDRLRQPTFTSAVHAVAAADGSRTAANEHQLRRRISEITRVTFVTELEDTYRIGSFELNVPSDIATHGNRIALRFVRGRFELYGLLARAIASMAEATPALQQPLADSIFRLLMSDSNAELERYLAQRGIAWSAGDGEPDNEETDDENESRAQVAEALKEKLLQTSLKNTGTQPNNAPAPTDDQPSEQEASRAPLPPLKEVELREAATIEWTPKRTRRNGRRWGRALAPSITDRATRGSRARPSRGGTRLPCRTRTS
jgi:hypothetical protein